MKLPPPPFILLAGLLLAAPPARAGAKIKILAAENVYGAVATAIAGPDADVTSVLANPAQDPHDFEPTPATARAAAGADLVILNGLDYDPWMDRLLGGSLVPGREIIRVADLVGAVPGGNPHLWYDPNAIRSVAVAITAKLSAWDAAHTIDFTARNKRFAAKLDAVQATIADMRKKYAGTKVTATESIFGLMANALGLDMRDQRFQLAVMNGTEPRAGDVAAIESDLRQHHVQVLFCNDQVSDAASQRLIHIARTAKIPVVGIDETMPAGTDYPTWIARTLAAVRAALSQNP